MSTAEELKPAERNKRNFKPTPGFEGYFVDSAGNIWSKWRAGGRGKGYSWSEDNEPTQRRTREKPDGYLEVVFFGGGRRVVRSVRCIVLEAFVSPRPKGYEALHLNGIKTDNRLINLMWATRTATIAMKLRHGMGRSRRRNWASKLSEMQAIEILRRGHAGDTPTQVAKDYPVCITVVSKILRRGQWKHLGIPPIEDMPHWHCRKLTSEQVRPVRKALADGEAVQPLARRHGVDRSVIYGIKDGRHYKDVQ
jgi:hypothetical protein